MRKILVPWSRPGYMQGSHPLMLAYLAGADPAVLQFPVEYPFDQPQARVEWVKRRLGQIQSSVSGQCPDIPPSAVLEFLVQRGSSSLSELFTETSGRLVFHHTVLHPLEPRQILHFENPSTLFFPFLWYSAPREFRLYSHPFFHVAKAILERDEIQMIFTHLETFRQLFQRVFRSPVIDRKTHLIRPHIPTLVAEPRREIRTVFFSNSFGSTDERFYLRGGLAALAAFLKVAPKYPDARLVMLSNLPKSLPEDLRRRAEGSGQVRLLRPGMSEADLNAECSHIDVLLNPSTGLHSMNILRAMSAGALVVASDVVGNEEYIRHGENGLIVPGARSLVNFSDPESGLGLDDYGATGEVNRLYVEPLTEILDRAFSDPGSFHSLRRNALEHVARNFTYGSGHCQLWEAVSRLP